MKREPSIGAPARYLAYAGVVDGDPAPASDAAGDELAILDRIQTELDDVARSLQRLDDGTYGTCEACGSAIDGERLEVQPAARWCVEHQPDAPR